MIRPAIDNVVTLEGANLVVTGQTDADPELPKSTRVYIEQAGKSTNGDATFGAGRAKGSASWKATPPAAGFGTGPAIGVGIEVRDNPITVTTWSQEVSIELRKG